MGNLRASYKNDNGVLKIVQLSDYDALGFEHYKNSIFTGTTPQQYRYQNQLKIDDFDIGWDMFKFRASDNQIGRFFSVDPLASDYPYNSPYALQENKFGLGVELEGKELGDFFTGVGEAYLTDMSPAGGPVKNSQSLNSADYGSGKKVGHYLALGAGLYNTISGGLAAAEGIIAEAPTLGLATVAVLGGAAQAGYGMNTIQNAVENLNSDSKNSNSTSGDNNTGRGSNHQKPDSEAQGDHSTFRTDPKTGKITNTATYEKNPKNPSGFQEKKRVDVTGKPHIHSKTKEPIKTPHVIEPKQKNPRPARADELPRQ
jgi:hypothetical protein